MGDPLVSIVVPCYGGERFIQASLESCLNQTYRNIEIIYVDDCSPDRSIEIAREVAARDPRVHIVQRSTNGGISRAFNTGYAVAKGTYFTRLAQDDVYYPNAIDTMVRFFGACPPDVGLIYGGMDQIDEDGNVVKMLPINPPATGLLPADRIGLAVMWRADVARKIGEFDPRMDCAEDYDYWLRIAVRYRIAKIDGPPLLGYRRHPNQTIIRKNRQFNSSYIRARARYFWQTRQWTRWARASVSLAAWNIFGISVGRRAQEGLN